MIGGNILTNRYQEKTAQQPSLTRQATGQIISGAFNPVMQKTDAEWKKILTPEQFHILREAGTEIPSTGELNNEKRKGTYYSVGCDVPLFRSARINIPYYARFACVCAANDLAVRAFFRVIDGLASIFSSIPRHFMSSNRLS